jgi:hypothetical protein
LPDLLTLKPQRGLLDVVDGERDALGRALVARHFNRNRVADSTAILHELQPLGAQTHRDDTNPRSGDAEELCDLASHRLDVGFLLEQQGA